ncbi:MADS-box transcription factor 20-like [Panicum miliaceum]|uniref:MADS-box transcription factor 20-like n=1 Tax=Panicum miliaceum TaxID=4540 RepID=A0A3L6RCJ5_PANMI|nr:MADS-box transcription factor 20-like [Panicum miliaceum]
MPIKDTSGSELPMHFQFIQLASVRRKVEVRRIENGVLCDADVALLVFSDKGRLHDFAAHDGSMERILDRYERYLLCEGGDVMEDRPEETQGNMSYDHIKLRSKIEALQKSQREVQQLEHQIDSALRSIRSRKERFLMEQNTLLEKEKAALLDPSLHAKNSPASSTSAEGAAVPNLNICAADSDDEPAPPPAAPHGAATGLPWWLLRPPASGQRGG